MPTSYRLVTGYSPTVEVALLGAPPDGALLPRLIVPSLGTGVRIPLGSFTVENDTEHMGCSERCRRQQQGTRVAARGSSVLRDASGVMSGVTPDLGRLETTGRSERSRCGLPIRNRVAGISIRRFYSTTRRMVTFSTRSSTRLRFDRPDTDQVPHRRAEAPVPQRPKYGVMFNGLGAGMSSAFAVP